MARTELMGKKESSNYVETMVLMLKLRKKVKLVHRRLNNELLSLGERLNRHREKDG